MTLKKCTVTRLDDVFWRVDVPGRSPISMAVFRSEHKTTVIIDGAMKCGGLSCGEDEAIDRDIDFLWPGPPNWCPLREGPITVRLRK